MAGVVVPHVVFSAYRALRTLGPPRPRPEAVDEDDTFRSIGDITHGCLVAAMTGVIERWRSGSHG